MCVVSMVFDDFGKRDWPWAPTNPVVPTVPDAHPTPSPFVLPIQPSEIAELRKLIAEFREAVEAAKTVDRLTGQPDCEDPDKAKLEQRVAELERRLNAMVAGGRPQNKRGATPVFK